MNYPQKLDIGGVAVVISQWKDGRVAVVYTAPGDNERTVKAFGSSALADAHVATLEKQFQAVPELKLVGQQKLIVERALAAASRCGMALDRIAEDYAALLKKLGKRTPMEAVDFYCQAVPEVLKVITLDELQKEYFAASERRPETIRKQGVVIKSMITFVEARKGPKLKVTDVTKRDLQDWLDHRPWSLITKWTHRGVVGSFFNYARKHDYLPENIPTVAQRLPVIKVPRRVRATVFTPEEMERLIHYLWRNRIGAPCYERALLFAVIGAFAGIRPEEIARMDWSEVLFDRHRIWIPAEKSKTHQERFVKISANLMKFLRPFRGRTGPIVISHTAQVVRLAARRIGLVWSNDVLRHSFGSYLLAKISDAGKVAEQMGNSLSVFYAHYRNAAITQAEARKYWCIEPPSEE